MGLSMLCPARSAVIPNLSVLKWISMNLQYFKGFGSVGNRSLWCFWGYEIFVVQGVPSTVPGVAKLWGIRGTFTGRCT